MGPVERMVRPHCFGRLTPNDNEAQTVFIKPAEALGW